MKRDVLELSVSLTNGKRFGAAYDFTPAGITTAALAAKRFYRGLILRGQRMDDRIWEEMLSRNEAIGEYPYAVYDPDADKIYIVFGWEAGALSEGEILLGPV